MRVRNITTCALGLAAALTLTSDLAAQDTTRLRRPSDQRISISKGEVVVPPRVDTLYVTRYDTVRVDNTIVRVDTVTVAAPAPLPEMRGPWYWGLYAGPTIPTGNIDRVLTNGFHIGGRVGWEERDGWWGARLDGAMGQLGRENFENLLTPVQIGTDSPLIWHLALDLKVNPLNLGGWNLYGTGGINWNSWRRIPMVSDNEDAFTGNQPCDFIVRGTCFQNANDDWSSSFGYNFGFGSDFHIGSQDMFIEARWFANPKNNARSWTVPISLGVRYF